MEYFVLGMLAILGTIWLFDGGRFHGFLESLGEATERLVNQVGQ